MKTAITKIKTLKDIPSASGIEIVGDHVYIIGDNSPWLFKLDAEYNIIDKIKITSTANLKNGVIPKKMKPDFEAMALIGNDDDKKLLIFSSGSTPQRESMIEINLQDTSSIKKYSLSKLYHQMKMVAHLEHSDFNIEAAVADHEQIYLFSRGQNKIFAFPIFDFIEYIEQRKNCPVPKIFTIGLPQIGAIKAGFSGAAITPDHRSIIFTASVENTSNWIDDGDILGSFVGVINIKELKEHGYSTPSCLMIAQNEVPLKIKVESVAIKHAISDELTLLLVTDHDGGDSELFEMKLYLP